MRLLYLIILGSVVFNSCSNSNNEYTSEIKLWKKERITDLTAPISWSSLIGLHWIKEGINVLGSSSTADIKFGDYAPLIIGEIVRSGDSLIIESKRDVELNLYGSRLITSIMLVNGPPETSQYNVGQYFFTAIQRNEKLGLRIWDTLHDARNEYMDLPYYPINEEYNIQANFKPYDPVKETTLKNVLGMDVKLEISGTLNFNIEGKEYTIEPLDGGPDEFFIIFEDETTGGDTYGGGRYLYCPKPNAEGYTYIDFNKAYTPPCGFTAFATCLLPSKENSLPIEITAGEKYEIDH